MKFSPLTSYSYQYYVCLSLHLPVRLDFSFIYWEVIFPRPCLVQFQCRAAVGVCLEITIKLPRLYYSLEGVGRKDTLEGLAQKLSPSYCRSQRRAPLCQFALTGILSFPCKRERRTGASIWSFCGKGKFF